MTEQDIRDAYVKIRTMDNTIPDEVLNFMKDTAIEKLFTMNAKEGIQRYNKTFNRLRDDK